MSNDWPPALRGKAHPDMTWVKGQGVKPTTGHWMTTERLNHVFWLMDTTLVATYVTTNTKPFVLLETSISIWIASLIKVAIQKQGCELTANSNSISQVKQLNINIEFFFFILNNVQFIIHFILKLFIIFVANNQNPD